MYREYKELEGLERHEILIQRAINKYYENPNICKNCKCTIKVKVNEKPSITSRKVFCSQSCSAAYNNTIRITTVKSKKTHKCNNCENLIAGRRKYCDSCATSLYKNEEVVTIKDVSYKKHQKSASFSYIRDRAKVKLKKERGQFCEICGYDSHVECAHIKSISSFNENEKLSIVNNIENLLWLCPNHHWEFDFGNLGIEEIESSIFYHKNFKKC